MPGAKVFDLCKAGNEALAAAAAKVPFKKLDKGIAFPTTVSVNNIICNYSPLPVKTSLNPAEARKAAEEQAESPVELKEGDVIKVQLGVHVDGYAGILAETLVVGVPEVTGPKADLVAAVKVAEQVALRALRVGKTNHEVARQIEESVKEFTGVRFVADMQTNLMDKNVVDGKKKIVVSPEASVRPDTVKIEPNEVYGFDLNLTTSTSGKSKSGAYPATVFKKTGQVYQLKLATARKLFSTISKTAGAFPFQLASVLPEAELPRARFGIQACAAHNLVQPFEVLYDEKNAFTAQVFFTAVVTNKGVIRVTPEHAGGFYSPEKIKSTQSVKDPKILELLAQPVRESKAKKN